MGGASYFIIVIIISRLSSAKLIIKARNCNCGD